jgi:hypothetical protein
MRQDKTMRYLKVLCGFGLLVVLVSNLWSISGWNEIRGVYDDLCYLRQAHLFQKSGLRGLDTNILLEDDHYLSSKLRPVYNHRQARKSTTRLRKPAKQASVFS